MGRVIRRILVRAIRFFVLRPVAVIGLVALVFAAIAAALVVPSTTGTTLALPKVGVSLPRPDGGEPQATAEYLRGNRDYNAQLIWESLGDDARQRLQARGASLDALNQQMQDARDRGVKLEDISYIGGRTLPDGTSLQFYLVAVRAQTKADVQYVPYMFTLDQDGKIAKIQ